MIVRKLVIQRITVIEFRMDSGGCNGVGCFEVEIWVDTAKFTSKPKTFSVKEQSTTEHGISAILQNTHLAFYWLMVLAHVYCEVVMPGKLNLTVT